MDKLTPERRSENMRRIRSKNTKPEMLVRQLVHRLGYRYRLHRKDLPGSPDLLFPCRRKVIFVHGCFWHVHPDPACRDSRLPRSNSDYWAPKLARNAERDRNAAARLETMGWDVLIVWECETKWLDKLQTRLVAFLDQPPRPPISGSR